jgi:hypothetical protein
VSESKPAVRKIPLARVYLHDPPDEKSRVGGALVK